MNEQDPNFLRDFFEALATPYKAALLALFVGYIRMLYDEKEPRPIRRLLEAILGGLIVLSVGLTCQAFELSDGYSFLAAGVVGTLGVDTVREWARKWGTKKVEA